MKNKIYVLISLIILFFGFDQITKYLAETQIYPGEIVFKYFGFGLTFTRNHGLVFGIGEALGNIRLISDIVQILFIPFSILFYAYYTNVYRKSWIADLTFILFFAGNLGNLTDSLLLHYVRDFIIWPGPGIPNVADIYANAGIICLVIEVFRNPQIDTGAFFGFKSKTTDLEERTGFLSYVMNDFKKIIEKITN